MTEETDLILAAEKYAEVYNSDERQDIKTDILNAFYHGAHFAKNTGLIVETEKEMIWPNACG